MAKSKKLICCILSLTIFLGLPTTPLNKSFAKSNCCSMAPSAKEQTTQNKNNNIEKDASKEHKISTKAVILIGIASLIITIPIIYLIELAKNFICGHGKEAFSISCKDTFTSTIGDPSLLKTCFRNDLETSSVLLFI